MFYALQGLCIAAGIYFLVQRQQALTQIVLLLALGLLVAAAFGFARALLARRQGGRVSLVLPGVLAALGAVLFVFREGITGIFPFLMGLWALGTGALTVVAAFKEKGMALASWWHPLPQAVLRVGLGVLILSGVLNLNALFTMALGIYLIVLGAVNLFTALAEK